MNEERALSRDDVDAMVESIAPNWTVRDATLAQSGFMAVYRLTLETQNGPDECFLKAARDDEDQGIALEARLLTLLDAQTEVPVPTVYGVVDEHPKLPAPFFLMEAMPGSSVSRRGIDDISTDVLEGVARSMGRYLADLHDLDAVGGFGFLEPDLSDPLRGDRPSGDVGSIRVADPITDWPKYVRESVDGPLTALADGPFADLVPDIRTAVDTRAAELSGPHRPVLAHVDASIENTLFDEGSGEVTAMLDWAFTIGATPAYDLVFVEHSLKGGPWWFVPSTPDHGSLIREGLIEGYRPHAPAHVVEQFRAHHDLYELLAVTHSMLHFEDRIRTEGATEKQIEDARERHREVVEDLL